MGEFYKIPWEKYGMIAYLAKKIQGLNTQFGKTTIQKLIYILQEIYGVNIGYKYILYNYGPYSQDLASDLDYVAALDGVTISWVNSGGYDIKPGDRNEVFIEKSSGFINLNKEKIDQAIMEFGGYNAKELELRATIIYMVHEHDEKDIEKIVEKVYDLKPYFSCEKIRSAVIELKEKGLLEINI